MSADKPDLTGLAGFLADRLDLAHPNRFAAEIEDALLADERLTGVTIWLVDFAFATLHDLAGRHDPTPVNGSLVGRPVLTGQGVVHGGKTCLPLGRRGQVIGVLELEGGDDDLITELQPSTVVIAHALLASRGHSDVVERIRGASSLSLAATIQYELLPYPTFTANGIDLGGKIEPAYDIAGDAFDYALNREGIHLAIFDAMGHGLRSTLLTSLVVGAYRLERRAGAGLPDVAVAIDRVVAAHARAEFVTGVLLFLDPAEGVVEVWNGGHLPPVLVRNRRAQAIEAEEALLPFGLGPETAAPTRVALQPDDNLFLYTDGVVQAKDGDDQFWGAERFVDLVTGRVDDRLPMFQICRQVLDTLGTFVGGSLQDDATVVGLRWSPPI